jgi:hypothetical protein
MESVITKPCQKKQHKTQNTLESQVLWDIRPDVTKLPWVRLATEAKICESFKTKLWFKATNKWLPKSEFNQIAQNLRLNSVWNMNVRPQDQQRSWPKRDSEGLCRRVNKHPSGKSDFTRDPLLNMRDYGEHRLDSSVELKRSTVCKREKTSGSLFHDN